MVVTNVPILNVHKKTVLQQVIKVTLLIVQTPPLFVLKQETSVLVVIQMVQLVDLRHVLVGRYAKKQIKHGVQKLYPRIVA